MRKLSKPAALLISACLILSWGCAGKKQQAEKVETGKDTVMASLNIGFQLKHNETALIESEGLSVEFLNVAEDSRCPVGVECIWAGQAVIELEIAHDGNPIEIITLISQAGRDELALKQINGYLFRLEKVEPPRTKDVELKQSDYEITLTVSWTEGDTGESSQ